MDLKKLLFGTVDNVDEFIAKSTSKILKWAFGINIAILTIVFFFLGGNRLLSIWAATGDFGEFFAQLDMMAQLPGGSMPIVGLVLSVIFIATLIFICVLRRKHTKQLDEKFWQYKSIIEADEKLMAQYETCYRKRARTYVLVNGYFRAKDKNSRVKTGYKSNTVACLWLTIFICIFALILLFSFVFVRASGSGSDWIRNFARGRYTSGLFVLFAVVLPIFYVWYTSKRFYNHKYYVANVTAQSLFDESYGDCFDQGFMDYIGADKKLSDLATKYSARHSKGKIFALFATWEDRLLFGAAVSCVLIYAWLVMFLLAKIAEAFVSSGSSTSNSSYSSSSSSSHSDAQYDTPTVAKRLVLTGRGYGQYYEIDEKYIREGLGTPYGRFIGYELHGREIWYQKDGQWKTMAIISVDGSDGRVMYLDDYDGEKIFERYEWKA